MNDLLLNIDRVHTTKLGLIRIKKNLNLNTDDVVLYCRRVLLDKKCYIYQQGKNWYCKLNNVLIVVNASSYTIITAHFVNS